MSTIVADTREVHRRLSAAQKAPIGPPYTVHVNRRLGRGMAAVADVVGLTPNTVTLVGAGCTAGGIALLAAGPTAMATGFWVTVLLLVGFALDSADGQLARLRGGGSLAGEWLDHVVDAAKVVSLHLAVAVHLYRTGDLGAGWLLVPLAFAVVNVVQFLSVVLTDQLRRQAGTPPPTSVGRPGALCWHTLLLLPSDYGLRCLVLVLLGWPTAFLAAYATLTALNMASLAVALVHRFRELDRLVALGATG